MYLSPETSPLRISYMSSFRYFLQLLVALTIAISIVDASSPRHGLHRGQHRNPHSKIQSFDPENEPEPSDESDAPAIYSNAIYSKAGVSDETNQSPFNDTARILADLAADGVILSLNDQLTLPLNLTIIQLGSILFPDPNALGGLAEGLSDQINAFEEQLIKDLRPSLQSTLESAARRHLANNQTGGYTPAEFKAIKDELDPIWADIIATDLETWRDTTLLNWLKGIKSVWEGIEDFMHDRFKNLEDYLNGRLGHPGYYVDLFLIGVEVFRHACSINLTR